MALNTHTHTLSLSLSQSLAKYWIKHLIINLSYFPFRLLSMFFNFPTTTRLYIHTFCRFTLFPLVTYFPSYILYFSAFHTSLSFSHFTLCLLSLSISSFSCSCSCSCTYLGLPPLAPPSPHHYYYFSFPSHTLPGLYLFSLQQENLSSSFIIVSVCRAMLL